MVTTFRVTIFFSIFCIIYCELDESRSNNRMIGIDAIHDVKIDKDTIITRNLKPEIRGRGKPSVATHHHKKVEAKEPDWSYSHIPKEVSHHVEQFKRNMTECLKEVQSKETRKIKRLSPKTESPVHGECLIACVLKRNGIINNGKIHKANLIALINKFYAKDTKLVKKLENNLDRCIEASARHREECALAAQLNDCTNDLMASNKHKLTVNY